MSKRAVKAVLVLLVLIVVTGASYAAYMATMPVSVAPLALIEPLVAVDSLEGKRRLERSIATDFYQIQPYFQPQRYRTTCGVASAVSIINALQKRKSYTQEAFLAQRVVLAKPPWTARIVGLSLLDMQKVLGKDSQHVSLHQATRESVEKFRSAILKALSDPGTVIVANYSRAVLNQSGSGHISPIGAYDPASDSVLVMDVAAHKYPATWVPISKMFESMSAKDFVEGNSRGWLEVSF